MVVGLTVIKGFDDSPLNHNRFQVKKRNHPKEIDEPEIFFSLSVNENAHKLCLSSEKLSKKLNLCT